MNRNIICFIILLGVILLQLIMTHVVTLVFSLFLPGMENFPQTHPVLFVAILGITYSTGVFLTGWLALRLCWLNTKPRDRARLAGTLTGAYLPLIVALIFYHPLEPGNPILMIAALTSVLGFHLPGWISRL